LTSKYPWIGGKTVPLRKIRRGIGVGSASRHFSKKKLFVEKCFLKHLPLDSVSETRCNTISSLRFSFSEILELEGLFPRPVPLAEDITFTFQESGLFLQRSRLLDTSVVCFLIEHVHIPCHFFFALEKACDPVV